MKRRIGSMLLTLAMVLALVPAMERDARAAGETGIDSWDSLYTVLNEANSGTTLNLKLTGNCTRTSASSAPLTVKSGVTVTLDLNGYTIDRKLTSATINGCVIKVNGNLTLKDSSTNHGGKITGGSNSGEGGGVYVGNNGTLTMESGTICENKCSGENGCGGGVYVANGGTFTMTGGTITGNTATNNNGGGGVYVYGTFNMSSGTIMSNTAKYTGGGVYVANGKTFTMTGGTITGNTATNNNGGGVYVNGTFKLSGSANITGNRKGTNESAADYINNVYLPSGKKITVSDNLTTAQISIRPADTDTAFTSGLSSHGNASHFASDDMNHAVTLGGSEAKLTAAYPVWVGGTQVTPENKDNVLSDDKVSYTPASGGTSATLTLNGATINTAYDYIYPYGSYVYIRTAGIFTAEKLKINVTDDSTITGVDTTKNYNNSYGVYAQADLEIAVADGKTLTVAGGSTTGTGSKDSYGVYVHSGSLQGFFTFSGPGTLNASGGASATWSNYGILASGAVTISGGTVNATGHTASSSSCGVRAESQGVNISGGSLTASGNDEAISGTVKNAIAGTGWTTADGTADPALIAVSSGGQSISTYKKVQFPAVTRTLTITPPTNGSLAVTANGSAVSGGGSVPVGAELTVTATPNSGYRLAALTVGDSNVTSAVSNNVYSFAMPNADTTVAATFAELAAVAAPTFTPAAGAVASGTEVTMTCATAGAEIYYTTDGSTPTKSSTKYTTPIPVTEAVTIKAIAIKDDMQDSAVASADYTIAPPAEACTITYAPGKGSGTMDAGAATEGVAFTLPECTFTAPNYKVFAGWKIGDTDTIVSAGDTYTFTGDTTVTATWRTDVAGNYQIYVKTLSGRNLTLNVIQGATIAQIKSVIEDELEIPPTQQHLASGGKLLEDERTLGWYNIQKEATLNMVYTVTVTNDGHGTGSASPAFGASNTSVTLTAMPASGYHFKEWQVVSGGVTVTGNSFTIGNANVEVKAIFEQDSTPDPTPTPTPTPSPVTYDDDDYEEPEPTYTVTAPVSGDENTVNVTVSVTGTAATLRSADIEKALNGNDETGDVVIDVSDLGQDITSITIPAKTVSDIAAAVADGENSTDSLTVKLTDGIVTFDAAAVAAITEQAGGSDLRLNLDSIRAANLKAAQRTAVADLEVEAVYDAYMTAGGRRISDFKGGSATVTVTYTLKDGQVGRGVVVWYVAEGGGKTAVPTVYDDETVRFTIQHFSNYVVAYDKDRAACPQDETCPIAAFTDADPTAWYHDGVHYVLENGIMSGYGNGLFGPGDSTSRAMMAQILWNLAGKPVVNYLLTFADTAEGQWYTEALRWATAEGIMNGYGNGLFGPDDPVTREQLAAIVHRYAIYRGVDVSATSDLLGYTDRDKVSAWALPSMRWAVGSGAVLGRTDTTLDPKAGATRAEIATIMMRHCTETAK